MTTPSIARTPTAPLAGLDDAIHAALQTFRGVGLAVAVVKDDEIVWLKGYGRRRHDDAAPYTPATVQNIGSISKTFAVDSVACLVDDGLLDWDTPIVEYMPWFRLRDPWVTAHVTARDIASFRLGTDMPVLGYYPIDAAVALGLSRREYVERLRFFGPANSFRDGHAYGNELFAVLTQLVEEVAGEPWEPYLRRRLLLPLGMAATSGDGAAFTAADEPAGYHELDDAGAVVGIPTHYQLVTAASNAPAGGVHTSAADMAQWMRLHLSDGTLDGRRHLSVATLAELHALQVAYRGRLASGPLRGIVDTRLAGNTLGWHVRQQRKELMLFKSGGNPGITTRVALLPDLGLGIYVQANSDADRLRMHWALINGIVDRFLDAPPFDWLGHYAAEFARVAPRQPRPERQGGRPPALPLAAYAGAYAGEGAYAAPAEVVQVGERLVFRIGAFRWELHHWSGERFLMWNTTAMLGPDFFSGTTEPAGQIFARFELDCHDRIAALVMEDAAAQIRYTRRDDGANVQGQDAHSAYE